MGKSPFLPEAENGNGNALKLKTKPRFLVKQMFFILSSVILVTS